jgi:diguanylate cyclase (GGDEF)-like protein
MSKEHLRFGFTPQEHRISALPATVASIIVLLFITGNGIRIVRKEFVSPLFILGIGVIGTIYLIAFNVFIIPSLGFTSKLGWINAFICIIGLGLLTYALPDASDFYLGVLLVILIVISSLISERWTSYAILTLAEAITIVLHGDYKFSGNSTLLLHLSTILISSILIETVEQLKKSSRDHIRKLEIITNFSRSITSTLEIKQVMALLSAAFQNSIEADAYFVGMREGDQLRIELLYDDGEFYENQRVNLEGSLSGWVLDNHQSLFLPDLRKEVNLPHVRLVLAGRHKSSLSWMGVPMRGENVEGLIVISSYRPNAFDRGDMELLTALAQHAAQAIDNAYHHAHVELQSQTDSLTNVYNHGAFLKLLENQLDAAKDKFESLSVIMLDIDYFKQYNDTFGHLAGDEVLRNLCQVIKSHLKQTDAVGRWGGEEFVISLPGANGFQAQKVAERIRSSLFELCAPNNEQITIPAPTISQGIAFYPLEADKTMKLIDLADKRLYIAKERGRNQIEPLENHWEKLYASEDG